MDPTSVPPTIPVAAISDARRAERLDDLVRTLGVTHAVLAGLYLIIGVLMGAGVIAMRIALADPKFAQASSSGPSPPPPWFFDLITIVYGGMAVAALLLMLLNAVASISAFRRRHRIFLIVVACLNCPFVPLGTAQGVFGLIVLMLAGMRERFEFQRAAVAPPLPEGAA